MSIETMNRKLLDVDGLAELLGVSADWLGKNYRRLAAEHEFPAPIPGLGTMRRWDPAAVHRWLDAQDPRAPAPEPGLAPGDGALAAELRGRAARLAGEI